MDPRRRVGQEPGQQVGLGAPLCCAVEDPPGQGQSGKALGAVGHGLHCRGVHTAYRGRVSRTPEYLAALASTAVPGLDPVTVRAVLGDSPLSVDVAFVIDAQDRHWVVRAPATAAAGAALDASVALLGVLARRLPFQVPVPKGFAAVPEGRAAVYAALPGSPLDFSAIPAGPGLAGQIGRAIAAIHNLDRTMVDDAGMPVYDAESYRTRRMADLDRGAGTGHVPASLLSRWERALDDVTLWRFAPTPVHGAVRGQVMLATFSDPQDAATAQIRGVTGWEQAMVADPADDFAALVAEAPPAAVESVFEAYANSRIDRPDAQLRRRARLAAELSHVQSLLTAVSDGRADRVRWCAGQLRRLAERVHEDDLLPPPPSAAAPKATVIAADVAPTARPHHDEEADLGDGAPTESFDTDATTELSAAELSAAELSAADLPIRSGDLAEPTGDQARDTHPGMARSTSTSSDSEGSSG